MKKPRTSSQPSSTTDLLVLAHPLVILSIITLLVNDHILKVYIPSWLTGKLSDFAGLFFFPVLLSVLLQLSLQRLHLSPRKVALLAFSLTTVWFTLIKTLPYFSDLTESILSLLLIQKTQIICDSTDLIALVILWPAWKLLNTADRQPKRNPKLAYGVLLFASIAILASSPAPTPRVRHLIVNDQTIYSDIDYYYHKPDEEIFPYSTDGGKTWKQIASNELPPAVKSKIGKWPERPVTLCLPDRPEVCYRTGMDSIFQSTDNGKTWKVSWQIPAGRKKFMQRYENGIRPIDMGPYDLALLSYNGEQVLIAAAGTEGYLIKTGSAEWGRIDTFGGEATPYQADSLWSSLTAVYGEVFLSILAAIFLLFLHILVNAKEYKTIYLVVMTRALGLVVLSRVIQYLYVKLLYSVHLGRLDFSDFYFSFIERAAYLISWICIPIFLALLIQQLITNTDAKLIGLISILIICSVSCLSFVLWAFGVIPLFEMATAIVFLLHGGFIVWLAFRLFSKISKRNKDPLSAN